LADLDEDGRASSAVLSRDGSPESLGLTADGGAESSSGRGLEAWEVEDEVGAWATEGNRRALYSEWISGPWLGQARSTLRGIQCNTFNACAGVKGFDP
jgi:hypothetical protein